MKTLSTLALALFSSISALAQFPETDVFVQGQFGLGNRINRTWTSSESLIGSSYAVGIGADIHILRALSIRVSCGYHANGEVDATRRYTVGQGGLVEVDSRFHSFTTNLNLGVRYWFGKLPFAIGLGGNLHSLYQGKAVSEVRVLEETNDPAIQDGTYESYITLDEKRIGFGPYAEALYRFKITDQIGLNTGLFYTYTIFPEGEDHGGFDLWSLNASVELSYSF